MRAQNAMCRARHNQLEKSFRIAIDHGQCVANFSHPKREIRHVPIVVSSGYGEHEAVQRFGDAIHGFLHKPYKVSDLSRVVAEALRKPA